MALAAPRYDENFAELALLEWVGELLHVCLRSFSALSKFLQCTE